MKKVLFLAHSALAGGAEYCLDTTLRNLNRAEIEPTVLFPTDGPMAESARNLSMRVEFCPFSWWILYTPSLWEWKNRLKIPFRIAYLKNFMRKTRFDCVYTNTVCLFEGAWAAQLSGIPHITHIHEVLQDNFMRPRWCGLPKVVQFFYRNSRNVIYESQAAREVAEGLLPNGDTDRSKSVVVSNSSRFSMNDVAEFQSILDEKTGRETFTLLWMGRFSERKNPLALVRAVEKIPAEERKSLRVRFIGEGDLAEPLANAIQNAKLGETCEIAPFQKDVRPALAAGDALALTSREESFGLVLVEAGMFGLPVIAARSQGPNFIVEDGQTGFLVAQNDSDALACAVRKLLQNRELRQTMGHANQLRVGELFDPMKNTKKIESLF